MFLSFLTSGTTSGGIIYELNVLLTVEQSISILFGALILFAVFSNKIDIHPSCKNVIFRLNMSILIVLTLASLFVNLWSVGRAFRFVRKMKQNIYNMSLVLFLIVCLIFLKQTQCVGGEGGES
jgi:hypothetical protein